MSQSDDGPTIELSSPPDMFRGPTYEHAARVGDFIFVAGQVAKDIEGKVIGPNDAQAQARAVFESLGKVLAHAGATPRDVVKVTTYLVDGADSQKVTPIRLAFFGDHRPPHTGVVIKALGSPEVRLEVEVIAVARRKPAGS
jgi:2-iminobutanoate/2-iminopropanoate deaminase